MTIALITGSAGLVGSAAVEYYAEKGWTVAGIDNNMRAYYFGEEASTDWNRQILQDKYPGYQHHALDIRSSEDIGKIFSKYGADIKLIIHTAAQPSHDWAAQEPFTDFSVNANGTLNLLEKTRQHCPKAVFIYTSTNKVYGDRPNSLPVAEQSTRWELPENHDRFQGIDESMSIDGCLHSLFGASKAAADLMVQEYGRYFEMKTVCFRGGCLTGPSHSGAQLHGFLSYLVKCCVTETPYTVLGYKGKQVRDNIHCRDLITAFDEFYQRPQSGSVYNIGGGRENNCSLREAVAMTEEVCGKKMELQISDQPRTGDHIWYISDLTRFKTDYPNWRQTATIRGILEEILAENRSKWDS